MFCVSSIFFLLILLNSMKIIDEINLNLNLNHRKSKYTISTMTKTKNKERKKERKNRIYVNINIFMFVCVWFRIPKQLGKYSNELDKKIDFFRRYRDAFFQHKTCNRFSIDIDTTGHFNFVDRVKKKQMKRNILETNYNSKL